MKAQLNYVKDNEATKCNCPRQCQTFTYQSTVSQAQLAVSAATFMKKEWKLDATVSDILRDYCLLEVNKQMNFSCSYRITGLKPQR